VSTLDSNQYKEEERQKWDNIANNWQKWWKTIERGAEKVSRQLIELAEIKSGSKVIDIATGVGEPAITAAGRVGGSGHILATDISPQMLSVTKERAISSGLQNVIEFKEGDIETIDLPMSTFDAALCRFGLMFLPDLGAGLSNIYKSLKEGGCLAAAVLGPSDKVPFISLPLNIVLKETNSPPPAANTPGPFSLSNENFLKSSFIQSGFEDVTIERLEMIFDFESAEAFTNFVCAIAAPIQAVLSKQSQERRNQILKVITDKVANRYADKTSGSVNLSNEVICIAGRK
jgi:ubiquinone/menaquinone biosynthesis C-methylase UbiE